jgi:hypothetical protein
MTGDQIGFIMSQFNSDFSSSGILYGEDIWMSMDEISEIILSSNENIYPDSTIQVKLDSGNKVMLIREGYYQEGGSFVATRNASITTYDQIIGFMVTKPNNTKSPYKRSASI